MNLKEATHKCLNDVLDENFKASIIDGGFKYIEKQSKFKMQKGDFKCEVLLKPEIDRQFLKEADEVRFNLFIRVTFFSSKFRIWFKKNLGELPQKNIFLNIQEQFVIYDKIFDSNNSNLHEIKKIEEFILKKVVSDFSCYNNWENVIHNYEKIKKNIDLEDVCLFLNKNNEASKILHDKRKGFQDNEEIVNRFSYLIDHVNLKLTKILKEQID